MKLFTIRHGETSYNAQGKYMGHTDIALNALGKRQAQAAARVLNKYKFDFIYCSDLKRTKQTLKEVLQFHKNTPVIYDESIRERKLGELEGVRGQDWDWDLLPGSFMKRKPRGGESLDEMKRRIKRFLEKLRKDHSKDTVLVVSHGGTMRMIHVILAGGSVVKLFKTFKFQNTAVCEYEISGSKVKIHQFNETKHL
ncbi:MAG TPA: histidine phosphatase family protein [Patescibacteria group bacterium]|nr:histidine phosphatase family protein [Patescibacteria group bacterium]